MYGGHLSLHKDKNDKPLIIMGHGECMLKQYLFTKKIWNRSNNELVLVLRDESQDVMITVLRCLEFGVDIALAEEVLIK